MTNSESKRAMRAAFKAKMEARRIREERAAAAAAVTIPAPVEVQS